MQTCKKIADKENTKAKPSNILSRLNAQRKDLKKIDLVKSVKRSNSFSQVAPAVPDLVKESQPPVKKLKTMKQPTATEENVDLQVRTGLILKSRELSEKDFEGFLEDRYFCTVSHLLGVCKPPSWDVPVVGDYVTAGILVEKSPPLVSKNSHDPTKKHVLFLLSDFKLSVTVMLVDGAYDQYWKEMEGSVIAILNAKVCPPKGKNTSIMLLVDSASSILMIGKARDFATCKATCRDGKPCKSHVNKCHAEYCDFHTNSAFEKAKSTRMAVAGSVSLNAGRKGSGNSNRQGRRNRWSSQEDGLLEETGTFGRVQTDSGGKVYCVRRTQGAVSAPADLSEEILQQRLNNKQQQRSKQDENLHIAVKSLLSSRPGTVGAQYLQAQGLDVQGAEGTVKPNKDTSFMFMPEAVRRIGFNPISEMPRDVNVEVTMLTSAINNDKPKLAGAGPRVIAKRPSDGITDIDLDSD